MKNEWLWIIIISLTIVLTIIIGRKIISAEIKSLFVLIGMIQVAIILAILFNIPIDEDDQTKSKGEIIMEIEGYKEISREIWRNETKANTLYVIKQWCDIYGGLNKKVMYFIKK